MISKIGKPVSFIFQGTGAYNPSNKYAATAWRLNPEHVGGYLSDGGVHQVTVVTECLQSKVAQVNAYTTQLRETSGDVDVLSASFKFENGVFGTFTYGSTFGAIKKTNSLQIFGTEGSIIYDWSPGSPDTVTLQVGPDSNNMGEPQVFTVEESKHFSVDSEFKNFFEAVEKKDKSLVVSNPERPSTSLPSLWPVSSLPRRTASKSRLPNSIKSNRFMYVLMAFYIWLLVGRVEVDH